MRMSGLSFPLLLRWRLFPFSPRCSVNELSSILTVAAGPNSSCSALAHATYSFLNAPLIGASWDICHFGSFLSFVASFVPMGLCCSGTNNW